MSFRCIGPKWISIAPDSDMQTADSFWQLLTALRTFFFQPHFLFSIVFLVSGVGRISKKDLAKWLKKTAPEVSSLIFEVIVFSEFSSFVSGFCRFCHEKLLKSDLGGIQKSCSSRKRWQATFDFFFQSQRDEKTLGSWYSALSGPKLREAASWGKNQLRMSNGTKVFKGLN